MAQGKIWDNILIFSRCVETWHLDAMFQRGWRIHDDKSVNKIQGRKGFAVNKDSKSADKTAERWSNAVSVVRQKARSRLAVLFDDQGDIVEERPNTPMKNLKVFNLEHRGQGGRAYKVLDEDGYVWDMREDVLLEAMITVGIAPGGTIGGEWVWGNVGSHGKLIRIGSQLHDDLTKSTTRKKMKKIGVRALEVGGVYRGANGSIGVFFDFCHSYGKKKQQLWFETYNFGEASDLENAQIEILENDNMYRWKVRGSSSYVEKIGSLDLKNVSDPYTRLRASGQGILQQATRTWDNAPVQARMHSYQSYNRTRYDNDFKKYMKRYSISTATVTPLEEPVIIPAVIQSILDRLFA